MWASWCRPCRKGMPRIDALARRTPAAAFVAISIDEDEAAARRFLAEVPLDTSVALDAEQTTTNEPLLIVEVPTILVVDAAGIVRLRVDEPDGAGYAEVERLVAELVGQ